MEATFRAGGLMSGLDSNAIIDQLTELQRRPINLVAAKKRAFEVQLSSLGSLTSKLSALKDSFTAFSSSGSLVMSAETSATGYSASASSSAFEGNYAVRVDTLASAAKARSSGFSGSSAGVPAGTLSLSIDGTAYELNVAAGATLDQVRQGLNELGAPISASIVNDGTSSYLVVTNKNPGFVIGDDPSSALTITESPTDPLLTSMLGLTTVSPATNARVEIDGLMVERRSNTISDALEGTTLTLLAETGTSEGLVVRRDDDATREKLQTLVDTYNAVMALVEDELSIGAEIDRSKTLAGDPSVRLLQRRLQALVTTEVSGSSGARSLAELGVKTQRDGTLAIDESKLEKALASDPDIIDNIVSSSGGIADQIESLVDFATDSVDGLLTQRTSGINKTLRKLDVDIENLELRVETFRENLIRRFVAMEDAISKSKSIGSYLSNVRLPGFTKGGD